MKKIILILVTSLILFFVGLYVYLSANARQIFNEQASALTNRKVTVESVQPLFPAGIAIKGFVAEGLLTVKSAKIFVNPSSLFLGNPQLLSAELENPVFFISRNAEGALNLPVTTGRTSSAKELSSPGTQKTKPVLLPKLAVTGGEIRLKDARTNKDWIVRKVQGQVVNVPLTGQAVKTDFFLTGSTEGMDLPFIGPFVKAKGWVNWVGKDMDAVLETMDDNGRVGAKAKLISKANELTINGHVSLTGRQQKQASGKNASLSENVILSVLEGLSTDIEADFSLQTKMDKIEIGAISLKGALSSGLNSDGSSGNIVETLNVVGEELLKSEAPAQAQ